MEGMGLRAMGSLPVAIPLVLALRLIIPNPVQPLRVGPVQ